MRYGEFLQERLIFLLERLSGMMLFLVLYVANDGGKLRVGIAKAPKTFLPRETAQNPFLTVDEIGRTGFYRAHQIGQCLVWF